MGISGVKRVDLAVCFLVSFCIFLPIAADAGNSKQYGVTQAEYLRCLVKISGVDEFSAPKSTEELTEWGTERGIEPSGGWEPEEPLSSEVFAETLVQIFNLDADNPHQALKKEGVMLPDEAHVSRSTLVQTFSDFGFQSRTAQRARRPVTPILPESAPFDTPPGRPFDDSAGAPLSPPGPPPGNGRANSR